MDEPPALLSAEEKVILSRIASSINCLVEVQLTERSLYKWPISTLFMFQCINSRFYEAVAVLERILVDRHLSYVLLDIDHVINEQVSARPRFFVKPALSECKTSRTV